MNFKNVLFTAATAAAALAFVVSVFDAFKFADNVHIQIALLWFIVFTGDVNYLIVKNKLDAKS